jgi:4'-phosphopantetheinyl transferase
VHQLLPKPEEPVWNHHPAPDSQARAGEVHVWRAAVPPLITPALEATLSEPELRYARRMASDSSMRQFAAAQAVLRTVLSRYLAEPPAQIEFRRGEHGKPFLATRYESDIQFNLTHSHDMAVAAITSGSEIGVDLEKVRPRPKAERLAARYYAPQERAALDDSPEDRRERLFLRLWTRKESHLKATGTGLSVTLRDIDTLASDNAWWYHEFAPASDYVATLAGTGDRPGFSYFDLALQGGARL